VRTLRPFGLVRRSGGRGTIQALLLPSRPWLRIKKVRNDGRCRRINQQTPPHFSELLD
jgi:hypothetical protein